MTDQSSFEVTVSGGSTSVDDYRKAMEAQKSELPELSEQQKFVAKKLGLSEEEYRRGVLAGRLGDSRMQARGKKLGEIIQGLLDEVGGGYCVEAVRAEMVKFQWLVRIGNKDREVVASIPRDLVDDAVDSGRPERIGRLKALLLGSLRSEEQVVKD